MRDVFITTTVLNL